MGLSAVAHILDVRLQSRMAWRTAICVDLRFGSTLNTTHHLAQEFGTDDIHRRLAIMSLHQEGELFQLLQHVSFPTELHESFQKPGVLLQLFQGTHLTIPSEDLHHAPALVYKYAVVRTTDTYNFVIFLCLAHVIKLIVYLDTGSGKHRQLVNLSDLVISNGEDYCANLLRLYRTALMFSK